MDIIGMHPHPHNMYIYDRYEFREITALLARWSLAVIERDA